MQACLRTNAGGIFLRGEKSRNITLKDVDAGLAVVRFITSYRHFVI
jgi:hypothetical protein